MHDLHIHLGGAVPSSVLWEILCDNGLSTEFRDFDAFHASLTVDPGDIRSLDDYLGRYFGLTERIQSSPAAAEVSAYQLVAKAYRRAKVRTVEMRFCPMKRVREGLHTLDAIILACQQGLERASMHYRVETGILFSLARDLSLEANWEIAQAAVTWRGRGNVHGARGVVGIDMAGPESGRKEFLDTWITEVAAMFEQARAAGLGTTYHIGETSFSGPDGLERVLERVRPDRIGHGIALRHARGRQRERILAMLKERQVLLELCPTVNLVTRSIESLAEMAALVRDLRRDGISFCLNTDGPYLLHTNLRREYEILGAALGADAGMLAECHAQARAASFLGSSLRATRNPGEDPA